MPEDVATGVGTDFLAYLEPLEADTAARCSMVGGFDTAMYDQVLRAGGPPLERLVALDVIESIGGHDERYRLRPSLRTPARSRWRSTTSPGSISRLSADLESFSGEARPVDRMRAVLLRGREHAEAEFASVLRAAVRAGDVTTCLRLLRLIEDNRLADDASVRRRDALDELARAYEPVLEALELSQRVGVTEGAYLHRWQIEQVLIDSLQDPGHRWPIQVRGSAGRGKSTLLQWLVTDRLDAATGLSGRRWACAFLDFDDLDHELAIEHPWLLMLEVVRQLDGQFAGGPFRCLIGDHRAYLTSLRRRPQGVPGPTVKRAATTGAQFRDRLLTALPDLVADRPTLVVLDTFEKVLLAGDRETGPGLVDAMQELLDVVPSLRLVLSGRGAEQYTQGSNELPRAKKIDVPLFADEESRAYLQDIRGITDPSLVDGIVEKSEGLAWQLALAADLVERHPDIDVEELRPRRLRIAWAIDRIIARIDDPVLRWVVRYGCVCRRITEDVIAQVLRPRIVQVMDGRTADDVTRDPFPPADHAPVFIKDLDVHGVATLWTALRRYRHQSSWVLPSDRESVAFDEQLRQPMNDLIEDQGIAKELHARLADYYDRRADSDDWGVAARELFYHRSRQTGTVDDAEWRAVALRMRQADRPDWAAALAADLLGTDYLASRVTPPLAAAAHVELAWARVCLARRDHSQPSSWAEIWGLVRDARGLDPNADPWTTEVLRGAYAAATGGKSRGTEKTDPVEQLRRAVDGEWGPASCDSDRRELLLIFADAQVASAQSTPIPVAVEAHQLSARTKAETEAAERLVGSYRDSGDLTQADEWARSLPSSGETAQLRAGILLAMGCPAAARAAVQAVGRVCAEWVEALIALCQPEEAIGLCTAALSGSAVGTADRASVLMSRGRANAALLDVDNAVRDLERAAVEFAQRDDADSQVLCKTLLFRLHARDIGNLRAARIQLDELARLEFGPTSLAWVRRRLLQAELDHLEGRPDDALDQVEEAVAAVAGRPEPELSIEVALAALCWAPVLRPAALDALETHLSRITPASARLAALVDIEAVGNGVLCDSVLQIVDLASVNWDGVDGAYLRGRSAELQRAAGQLDQARYDLAAMRAGLGSSGFTQWRWLQAMQRLSSGDPTRAHLRRKAEEYDGRLREYQAHRLLRAAHMLTVLELQTDAKNRTRRRRLELLGLVEDELDAQVDRKRTVPPAQRRTKWHRSALVLRQRWTTPRGVLGRDIAASIEALDAQLGLQALDSVRLPAALPAEVALYAELDVGGGALVVSAGADRGTEVFRRAADHALVTALREGREGAASAQLLRTGWALRLRDPGVPRDHVVSVRVVDVGGAACLPWEIATVAGVPLARLDGVSCVYRHRALPEHRRIRYRVLQEALLAAGLKAGAPDGDVGPNTRTALRALHGRRTLAHDADPGPEDPMTWKRLREMLTPAVPTYRMLTTERRDDLDGVADEPVDILWLVGDVVRRGGKPCFALGPSAEQAITTIDLDSAVRRMATGSAPRTPLVVLDLLEVPRASSETMVQLLRRNAYADALIALGGVHTVLATGLAVHATAEAADEALRDALLTESGTVADVARRLQHGGPADAPTPENLASRATALFTVLAPDEMLPLGFRRSASS